MALSCCCNLLLCCACMMRCANAPPTQATLLLLTAVQAAADAWSLKVPAVSCPPPLHRPATLCVTMLRNAQPIGTAPSFIVCHLLLPPPGVCGRRRRVQRPHRGAVLAALPVQGPPPRHQLGAGQHQGKLGSRGGGDKERDWDHWEAWGHRPAFSARRRLTCPRFFSWPPQPYCTCSEALLPPCLHSSCCSPERAWRCPTRPPTQSPRPSSCAPDPSHTA